MIIDGIDLNNPNIDKINIDYIAHNLGNLCRFHGQVVKFYSVAEHSIHISDMILKDHDDASFALAGLLHDAAEAITGDIITPVKIFLPNGFDDQLTKAIFDKFEVDYKLMEQVKYYDEQALQLEGNTIYIKNDDSYFHSLRPKHKFIIHHWNPLEAMTIFLERFNALQEKVNERT